MPDVGYPSRVRETVSKGRSGGKADLETDPLRNLAYVVSSANDNITALQKTVKQQEKELCAKTDQIASLQRNYATLSRIRQADQSEFTLLKELHEQHQAALAYAQAALEAERERAGALAARLSAGEAEREELQDLRARAVDLARGKAEAEVAAEAERTRAAELSEAGKRLHLQVEKLGRAQAETLARAAKMDEACAKLQEEKAAVERGSVSARSKLAVQERQLRTFLEANEVTCREEGDG
jgi:chromosome segregation ATPase